MTLIALTDSALRRLDTPEARAELVKRGLLPCPEALKRAKEARREAERRYAYKEDR